MQPASPWWSFQRSSSEGADSATAGTCSAPSADHVCDDVVGQLGEACALTALSRHASALRSLSTLRRHRDLDSSVAGLVDYLSEAIQIDKESHRLSTDTAAVSASPPLRAQAAPVDVVETDWQRTTAAAVGVAAGFAGADGVQPSVYADVASGVHAFREAILSVTSVRRKLLMCHEAFVAVGPAVKHLRYLRDKLLTYAKSYPLFSAPLVHLSREMELVEALLAAEFKASRLNGVGAFADLARADRLLGAYFGSGRFVGQAWVSEGCSIMTSAVESCGGGGSGCGGVSAPASTSPTAACKAERRRPSQPSLSPAIGAFGSNCSLVSAASAASSTSPSPAARIGPTLLSSERSVSAPPFALPLAAPTSHAVHRQSGVQFTELEQRYLSIRAHCVRKLRFLCGSGFSAAARLGPRQILEAQAAVGGGGSATAVGSSAPCDADGGGPRRRCQVERGPACSYSEALAELAELPGVAFAGVFANAKQLPQLQASCRLASGAGLSAPLQDSAWLCPANLRSGSALSEGAEASTSASAAAEAGCWAAEPTRIAAAAAPTALGGPEGGGDFDWWALTFVTAVSPGKALEEWRQRPELKLLRTALMQACRKRHAEGRLSSCRSARGSLRRAQPQIPAGHGHRVRRYSTQGSAVAAASSFQVPGSPALPHGESPGLKLPIKPLGGDALLGRAVDVPSAPTVIASAGSDLSASEQNHPQGNPRAICSSGTAPTCSKCLVLPLDLGWFQSPLFVSVVLHDSKRSCTEAREGHPTASRQQLTWSSACGSQEATWHESVVSEGASSHGGSDAGPPRGAAAAAAAAQATAAGASAADYSRGGCCTRGPPGRGFLQLLGNLWRRSMAAVAETDARGDESDEEDPTAAAERLLWRLANSVSGRDLRRGTLGEQRGRTQ